MNNETTQYNINRLIASIVILNALSACSTTPTKESNPSDPWENWNRSTYKFNQDFDKTILKPVAKVYENNVPNPVNEGITNIFSNINDIGVTINDFLQFKFKQGGMDASRFLINSTAGLVGFFDVAKKLDLPKHHEDFGQTLGVWGLPSGPYLVLPFMGSSSPRDTAGLLGDVLLDPLTYVSLFGGFAASAATASATAVDVTDERADLMSSEKIVDEASVDRYDFIKNSYKQRRNYLIHDGNPPDDSEDPLLSNDAENVNSGSGTGDVSSTTTSSSTSESASKPHDPNKVIIIDNSSTMPKESKPNETPVIDNSTHILELTAPEH